jgi:transposase-like protein
MTKEMDKNMGGRPIENQLHDATSFIIPEIPATYAERKPIWIVMRRTGMSYRQIGEVSGVSKDTVQREVSTISNETVDLPATVVGKDGKERAAIKPKPQMLDSYLRCYTQEEIADKEGLSHDSVQRTIDEFTQNGKSAELRESPGALHQIDFEIPLYNYALSSTTINLTADRATDGVILPGRSPYTLPSAKSAISELATAYNRILRGLTSWVGQLFPVSEDQHELQH